MTHLTCPARPGLHNLRAVVTGRYTPLTVVRVAWVPGTQHPVWESYPHQGYSHHADGAQTLPVAGLQPVASAITVALAAAPRGPEDADHAPVECTLVRVASATEARHVSQSEQTVTLLHNVAGRLHQLCSTLAPGRLSEVSAAQQYVQNLLGIYVPLARHERTSSSALSDADREIERVYPRHVPAPTTLIVYPEPDHGRVWFHDLADDAPVHYPYTGRVRAMVEDLIQICPYAPTSQHFDRDRVAELWPCDTDSVRSLMRRRGVPTAYRDPGGRSHYRADLVLNARRSQPGRGSWHNRRRPA